jgi:hypothetical protein
MYKDLIFTESDCKNLIDSVTGFTKSKLYYTSGDGSKNEIISLSQRNSLQYDFDLLNGKEIYNKLDVILQKFGYKLIADKLICNLVRYEEGHYIFKHRHDTDGDSFLTFVVQLSDSNEYEGGDFIYWDENNQEHTMERIKGFGYMISADVAHEVRKVTKNVRHSFVVFIQYENVIELNKKRFI